MAVSGILAFSVPNAQKGNSYHFLGFMKALCRLVEEATLELSGAALKKQIPAITSLSLSLTGADHRQALEPP